MKAAIHRSPPISRTCSNAMGRRPSSYALMMILPILPSRAASRTGSLSRTRSGIPRTTGIWQTVWMEAVPSTYIGYVRFTPVVERWEIGFEARLFGERREGLRMTVKLNFRDQLDRRRYLYRGRRRSPSPDRALRSRHRRLPQYDPMDPLDTQSDRCRDEALERSRRIDRSGDRLHSLAIHRRSRATASF